PPGDVLDDLYLQRGIEIALASRGVQIARTPDAAKYRLTCLVGAIGLDISGRFIGLPGGSGSVLIPVAIPELPLYKNTLRRGVAKLEIHLVDLGTHQTVHRSGPVEGSAFRRSKTFFFVFESRDSDTTRLE
ncbi:MAG: hypothetical protein JRE43_07305, partial [Deltaproteobacteria bacterium]|nr:hypothetical protein [Deltaproteobacteria bacterium]